LAIKTLWSWKLIIPPPAPNIILCFSFGGKLLQIGDLFLGKNLENNENSRKSIARINPFKSYKINE